MTPRKKMKQFHYDSSKPLTVDMLPSELVELVNTESVARAEEAIADARNLVTTKNFVNSYKKLSMKHATEVLQTLADCHAELAIALNVEVHKLIERHSNG